MTGEESAGTSDFSWKCVFNIEGKHDLYKISVIISVELLISDNVRHYYHGKCST